MFGAIRQLRADLLAIHRAKPCTSWHGQRSCGVSLVQLPDQCDGASFEVVAAASRLVGAWGDGLGARNSLSATVRRRTQTNAVGRNPNSNEWRLRPWQPEVCTRNRNDAQSAGRPWPTGSTCQTRKDENVLIGVVLTHSKVNSDPDSNVVCPHISPLFSPLRGDLRSSNLPPEDCRTRGSLRASEHIKSKMPHKWGICPS